MLMRLLYNIALLALMFLFFPKILWQLALHGKYRKSLWKRFRGNHGFRPPKDAPIVWLHAISVGESKALSTLTPHIRKTYPHAFILISTVTETGQETAKKLIPEADAFCYLPLDFPWIIKRFVKDLRPNLLILIEGDFWYNLLNQVKKEGGKVILVNGKVSERSLKRYLYMKSFSQALFKKIDAYAVQSEVYLERFLKLGVDPDKLNVVDNLKYDIPLVKSELLLKEQLGIALEDFVVTAGSTHLHEENALLDTLSPLLHEYPHLKLCLVPRHPERFHAVEKLLQTKNLPYLTYSNSSQKNGNEQIILIDQMGILPECYRLSKLSIVGGSFIKGVGGHDVFEPIRMGIPVIFGPYMHAQEEFVRILKNEKIGKQVKLGDLEKLLKEYLANPSLLSEEAEKGKRLAQKLTGSSFRTWKFIEPFLKTS